MARTCAAGLLLAAALVGGGCAPRPRAPALMQGEPVYQNKQEGFRFLPPPNWSLHARSEVPPGKLGKERLLVGYKRVVGSKVSSLDVTAADAPASADLAALLEERGSDQGRWRRAAPVEPVEVGGRPAARAAFAGQLAGGPVVREVVAVRRGERVYYFSGVYPAGDTKSRDQIRKAVASVTW